jgi:hypothetical protein
MHRQAVRTALSEPPRATRGSRARKRAGRGSRPFARDQCGQMRRAAACCGAGATGLEPATSGVTERRSPARSACKSLVSAPRASPVRHLFTIRIGPLDSAADANGDTDSIVAAGSDRRGCGYSRTGSVTLTALLWQVLGRPLKPSDRQGEQTDFRSRPGSAQPPRHQASLWAIARARLPRALRSGRRWCRARGCRTWRIRG